MAFWRLDPTNIQRGPQGGIKAGWALWAHGDDWRTDSQFSGRLELKSQNSTKNMRGRCRTHTPGWKFMLRKSIWALTGPALIDVGVKLEPKQWRRYAAPRLSEVTQPDERFYSFLSFGFGSQFAQDSALQKYFWTFSPFNACQWKFYLTDQSLYLALLNQIQRPPFSYNSKSCCFYKLSHLETKIFAHSSFQISSSSVTLEGEQLWTSVWAPSHMCVCRIRFTSTL